MNQYGIRVEAYAHAHFADQAIQPEGPPWVRSVYESLVQQFGIAVDEHCLNNGKNNDFFQMGRRILGQLESEAPVGDVSYLFVAHQTFDTYYPFQSAATLLCNEFNIGAPAVVMTEQAFTTPYIALMTLMSALRHIDGSASGLLLVFDQATLPYAPFPEAIDTAVAFKLTRTRAAEGTFVDGSRLWHDGVGSRAAWLVESIHSFLSRRCFATGDVQIVAAPDLLDELSSTLAPRATRSVEEKFMSAAGLVGVIHALGECSAPVLLVHLSQDGHLYLNLFSTSALCRVGHHG